MVRFWVATSSDMARLISLRKYASLAPSKQQRQKLLALSMTILRCPRRSWRRRSMPRAEGLTSENEELKTGDSIEKMSSTPNSSFSIFHSQLSINCMILNCFDLGCLEYLHALALQKDILQRRCEGAESDTLLLLEHPPVFTLGRGAEEKNLLTPREVPVHRISRGGEATFHGPGQLVGYPLLDLTKHGRDVHVYLRGLEVVLVEVLATCGIAARRETGKTGVWVDDKKIASIGVGVRRWVTCHGFAL